MGAMCDRCGTEEQWLMTHRPARYFGRMWSAERRSERARRAARAVRGKTLYYRIAPAPVLVEPIRRTPLLRTSPHLRLRLWKAQGGLCYLCGAEHETWAGDGGVTVDHVKPRAAGGRHSKNRLLACAECNNRKADRAPYPCELLVLAGVNLALYGASSGRRPVRPWAGVEIQAQELA